MKQNTKTEVKTGEYQLVDIQDNLSLYTRDLGKKIACVLFSPKLNKVALVSSFIPQNILKLFKEINPDNIKQSGLINVSIIGGDKSAESASSVKELFTLLQQIDNGSDIINVISYDVCEKVHPDSFEVNCYHGGILGI